MKISIIAATAAALLASVSPALAQDHRDGDRHDQGYRPQSHHMAPPPRRFVDAHRFREGQIWHGHHLAYRYGQWGYYQPHNGAQLFIHINI